MSFLDAMTCGFGAVILFFMIISANVDVRSDEVLEDRSAEVNRLELQVDVGEKNLAELRQQLASLLTSKAETEVARDTISAEIVETREELQALLEDASANQEMIEELKADLARLEEQTENLASSDDTLEQTGNFIRQIRGEGYRQYLTGLRMGGQRLLIMVDISTSMLGRSLPEITLERIKDDDAKRQAPKWQQVVDTVDWLTAQITPGTQFQLVVFNSEAWFPVPSAGDDRWLTATDGSELQTVVDALRRIVPGQCHDPTKKDRSCGATSLHAAFDALNQMLPRPDNVYLLVDGLPTMGENYPSRPGANGRDRWDHFERAQREVSGNVPINVLLYALEGDPLSAPAYWSLALRTGGSMMAPSEDWP
jgi:hypothetical protein